MSRRCVANVPAPCCSKHPNQAPGKAVPQAQKLRESSRRYCPVQSRPGDLPAAVWPREDIAGEILQPWRANLVQDGPTPPATPAQLTEIGRASCRERV